MGVDWNNVLDAGTRGVLERQALLPFLRRQRWMVPAAREIRQARFADWAALRAGSIRRSSPSSDVEYVDGTSESCLVPLALVDGEAADAVLRQTPGVRARADHRRAQRRDRRRHDACGTRERLCARGRAADARSRPGTAPCAACQNHPATRPDEARAQAVPPHRAIAKPRVRDRPIPDQPRLHAHPAAGRRARIRPARSAARDARGRAGA